MSIPGLSRLFAEASLDAEPLTFTTFNLKTFTVPGSHKFGNCRRVSDFQKLRTVGEGDFGIVHKVEDIATKEVFALKKLKIPHTPEAPEVIPQHFLREIGNLKLLKHENIVNLKEVVAGKNFDSTYLLLDFCEYSLGRVVDQVHMVYLQHKQIKNIMQQLLTGLDYIHKFSIVHRDLTPTNILFTESGTLKISDFASSRKVTSQGMTPNKGHRWYKAPEVLFGATNYTVAVDVWAVGCIFAEMIRQRVLFRGDTDGDIVKMMIDFLGTPTERSWPGHSQLPVPQTYYLNYQPYNRIRTTFDNQTITTANFLQKLLIYNPPSRPTAEDCLKDAYFSEYPRACSREELVATLQQSTKL